MKRRTLAEARIHETLRASVFDPAYGAQFARTAAQIAIGKAIEAVTDTRPSLATLDALDELLEALHRRALEVRGEK